MPLWNGNPENTSTKREQVGFDLKWVLTQVIHSLGLRASINVKVALSNLGRATLQRVTVLRPRIYLWVLHLCDLIKCSGFEQVFGV
jgi:hypothetical protein